MGDHDGSKSIVDKKKFTEVPEKFFNELSVHRGISMHHLLGFLVDCLLFDYSQLCLRNGSQWQAWQLSWFLERLNYNSLCLNSSHSPKFIWFLLEQKSSIELYSSSNYL